jgi:hypothetical protein
VHTSTAILTGGEKMPSYFKALATISVWVLFIAGLGYIGSSFVDWARLEFEPEMWKSQAAFCAIGTASVILSVIAMKIRQKME